jgi:hypothetical protein
MADKKQFSITKSIVKVETGIVKVSSPKIRTSILSSLRKTSLNFNSHSACAPVRVTNRSHSTYDVKHAYII